MTDQHSWSTRGLHVVHLVPALFGDVMGGAERYALELAHAMARRVPTTLVTFGHKARREQMDDLRVHVVRNWVDVRRFKFDPLNPLMIRELAHADIIHCHQPETM